MKKIFYSVVVFAVTFLPVQAITLEDALIAAFLNNKEWAANKTDKNAAEARYKQAVLAFLPNVSGTVSATRERDDRHLPVCPPAG